MKAITADLLVRAVGCTRAMAAVYAPHLAEGCRRFEINTSARLAAFLAQIGHESGSFGRVVENLNYGAEGLLGTWPSRFTRVQAAAMARKPEQIANYVYAGRLGNTAPGDGWRYRGRGLIQNTGKANYEGIGELLRQSVGGTPDFVAHPEQLEQPRWAALAACAYWADHHLSQLADKGEFDKITTRINGGQIGRADRRARYEQAKKALV
ncbi:glycoside hydrolase family 19 protein [Lysobacter sp. 5GHs7-4]|uniref:glycoside hydrolase family 19 protein n=1 Tax=Lysobacter sp. 5GHs7-4 TaxID=2904253 RepID=UPI001E45FDBD|nr:glycoside hydrolase family 19 protein [Lysobacter sp. 5GHs7-4]UHQ21908.1 glycoside hydrolase family 19 protein [Lysobacter sp. 5GHs7-4]